MSKYLHNLIAKGEHLHLDFKYEISDAKKIARTFSAFANTKGGTLLIGVKDNGVIKGIQTDEELYMVESSAMIFSKPEVKYSIETWTIQDKTVLEVKIPESQNKPHLAPWKDDKWKAFIRVDDENFLADAILVDIWKDQRKSRDVHFSSFEEEKAFLEFIDQNESVSLHEVMNFKKLNYFKTKKLLSDLVYLNILDYSIHKDGTRFCLH